MNLLMIRLIAQFCGRKVFMYIQTFPLRVGVLHVSYILDKISLRCILIFKLLICQICFCLLHKLLLRMLWNILEPYCLPFEPLTYLHTLA